jgi:hypothetical protein
MGGTERAQGHEPSRQRAIPPSVRAEPPAPAFLLLDELLLGTRRGGSLAERNAVLRLQRSYGNARVNQLLAQRSSVSIQRATWDEIKKVLEVAPGGKAALGDKDKYKVGISYRKGGGSEYSNGSNSMIIDSDESAAEAALTVVHEMYHATTYHEGKWADATKLAREDYIKAEIEEESEGTVRSIELKVELEGTKIDVSKATFPLEQQYRKAYKEAVDALKSKDPKATDAALKAAGRAAGKARVVKGFNDGEVVASTSKETYPEFYGKRWDKKNKKK